ncbi:MULTISPECIES: hypothetical protein [Moorena]|uniref:hypothetical protein n=1 Tax=Moorena TaxID=1155738 RepID=UPI0002FE8D69|nr:MULTISPECIES: hypothetical protein [Moorena]NEQ15756.1 hypothetical protein [Moorena sp. SIO3E2]NEP66507.1 hypothetical protein [Moorena sp. SIO3A5]NEQ06918.1 hypothetical protein [Moorena sp. SIO4E2]NER90187.1 hypothetical protein [Moorena sp. SIO3A2]NES46560.1 hypothetical protein [Moorena sp. SIO2C4]
MRYAQATPTAVSRQPSAYFIHQPSVYFIQKLFGVALAMGINCSGSVATALIAPQVAPSVALIAVR